jgi:hypothetical protein
MRTLILSFGMIVRSSSLDISLVPPTSVAMTRHFARSASRTTVGSHSWKLGLIKISVCGSTEVAIYSRSRIQMKLIFPRRSSLLICSSSFFRSSPSPTIVSFHGTFCPIRPSASRRTPTFSGRPCYATTAPRSR